MSWVNKKFIYEDKVFDKSLFKTYSRAFELRQDSDYDAIYVPNKEVVKSLLKDAKNFIDKVLKVLD